MCGNTSEYNVNNKVQSAEKVSEVFFFLHFHNRTQVSQI